jgi:hypothetical protein
MRLKGSCHCGAVRFALESKHPYPFNLCYCSICRKTAGGGGYAINLGGEAASLEVEGRQHISKFNAIMRNSETDAEEKGPAERSFCARCGSALWVWDARWPQLIHPFASAIDTPLPVAPELVHLMLDYRALWVPLHVGEHDKRFPEYPQESIAEWHRRLGVEDGCG